MANTGRMKGFSSYVDWQGSYRQGSHAYEYHLMAWGFILGMMLALETSRLLEMLLSSLAADSPLQLPVWNMVIPLC